MHSLKKSGILKFFFQCKLQSSIQHQSTDYYVTFKHVILQLLLLFLPFQIQATFKISKSSLNVANCFLKCNQIKYFFNLKIFFLIIIIKHCLMFWIFKMDNY